MRRAIILFLSATLLLAPGCASIAEGLFRSALGLPKKSKEDFATRHFKEQRRLKEQRKWIQHWRDYPRDNPAMTEAFKDDYR